MADKPTLFSAPMVRALIAGTKTQTRRTLKGKVAEFDDVEARIAVGDRLYVREAWRVWAGLNDTAPRDLDLDATIVFEAGGSSETSEGYRRIGEWPASDAERPKGLGRFRQGMHMPRWASRLTLTVSDVRVERLQDISEADALAEGVKPWPLGDNLDMPGFGSIPAANVPAKTLYCYLWEHINGSGSWTANPWVAAYSFTVALGNIDQVEK